MIKIGPTIFYFIAIKRSRQNFDRFLDYIFSSKEYDPKAVQVCPKFQFNNLVVGDRASILFQLTVLTLAKNCHT